MKFRESLPWILLLSVLVVLAGCGSSAPPEDASTETAPAAEIAPPAETPEPVEEARVEPPAAEPEPEPEAPPKVDPAPVVVMETSMGTIMIELDRERTPETVANFLQYVDDGFYDGTIFHRVIKNFMIQGGGFTGDMTEKPTRPSIKNESANNLANLRGTISMARTAAPHSASSQFFINHRTNLSLNKDQARDGWGYCVFGKVIEGMDVVDKIADVAVGKAGGHQNVPVQPVTVRTARRAS